MIIDGKKIAAEKLGQIKTEIAKLPFVPKLIDVLVGVDPVTESYVKIKAKRAAEVGIDFEIVRLAADISETALQQKIIALNKTPRLCGLIVQLPLPKHLKKQAVLDCIDPEIDADMITTKNVEKFEKNQTRLVPATAAAIFEILKTALPDYRNKNILVIGQGDLVGKPVTALLKNNGLAVRTADQATVNLEQLAKQAEVIISGTGRTNLLRKEMLNKNTIIIDAGTAESAGGISGDADFEALKDYVNAITPVPGGVGPVTVAMLLWNVLQIAKNSEGKRVSGR